MAMFVDQRFKIPRLNAAMNSLTMVLNGTLRVAVLICTVFVGVVGVGLSNAEAVEEGAKGADSVSREQLAFFEKSIRPMLAEHCYKCHGPKKQKSKLRVDSLAGLLKGGEYGPSIKPGNAKESVLILAINHGEELQMPAKKKLPAKVIADLTKWVQMGAPWPNAKPFVKPVGSGVGDKGFSEEQKSFWAFQPIIKPMLPKVILSDWIKSPVDRFVLARLEAKRFLPAPAADKRTLIRRATFDLIGLPPTVKEVEAFVVDESDDAFAKVVDRLLASPRYGERWGRHWLDVARYADSNGLDENLAYANAYRYRDYVIRAFNDDKPYDRFVQEQLAGDLLPEVESAPEQANLDRLIATAFLSLGPKMLAEDDPRKMQMDIVDEQVDTVSRTFMGLTMGCARCHDHKFDPLPTEDYYSLAAIFKSTKTMENFKVVAVWHEHELATDERKKQRAAHEQKLKDTIQSREQRVVVANEAFLANERKRAGDYLSVALSSLVAGEKPGAVTPRGKSHLPVGAIVKEAEDYSSSNLVTDTTKYGKGIGIVGDPGRQANFVEYKFKVPKAGKYQVEFRYAAKESRPARLLINGTNVNGKIIVLTTGGWFPQHQRWEAAGLFQFKAGENVVRIENGPTALFPHLDMVMIVPEGSIQRQINEEIVNQWVGYLRQARENKDPLWQGLFESKAKSDAADIDKAVALYRDRFVRALNTWQVLQKKEPEAKGLADESLEPYRSVLFDTKGPMRLPGNPNRFYLAADRESIAQLDKQKKELEKSRPAFARAMGVREGKIENLRVHYRGNYLTLGSEVPRRFPRIIAGDRQAVIGPKASGRLEFARWLTSSKHPLTARVMANRVWRWHFGKGIVRTPDNFGLLGERPDHPQLLDWLAHQLLSQGWSIKKLHRTIMLSSTYGMSTQLNTAAASSDPENRLLWRFNRRRLEAEAIRDSLIFLGGELDTAMYGQLLGEKNRAYVTGTGSKVTAYQNNRRSVYQPILRSAVYPVLLALDFPDPAVINGDRATTTVAPQALLMINSDLVAQHTAKFARQLMASHGDKNEAVGQRINRAYLMAYARPATSSEAIAAEAFLNKIESAFKAASEKEPRFRAWQSFCRVMLAANEFVYMN